MIVLRPPLLREGWGGHPLCLSGHSSVLMDLHWPCSCTAQSSIVHRPSICRSSVRHFPEQSWTAVAFPCAVLFNSSIGDWFRTTVGVRQDCLLLPNLFNIFLERIMTDALENHEGTVSIGGRTITNLRFANDIDDLAGEKKNWQIS